jgi:ketosteroid isomerase-like protein
MGVHGDRLKNLYELLNKYGMSIFDDPQVIASLPALVDENVECKVIGLPGISGTYHGIDGYLQLIREWGQDWSQQEHELLRVEDGEDWALAIVRHHAKGARSGAEVSMELAWVVHYRDSKLFRWNTYADPADALREAGIEP